VAAPRLSSDPVEFARLVRALDASVNVALLRELCRARAQRGEGWRYLSELAQALGEAPGTIGAALDKLGPFVEEKREKGLRYVRATVVDVAIESTLPRRAAARAQPRAPARPRRRDARG